MKRIVVFLSANALVLAGILAVVSGGCRPRPDVSEGVRLVTSSAGVDAATTFELRFDAPAVDAAAVGEVAPVSPLRIEPPLAGRFQWLGVRSGVFTPTEPLRLDCAYRFRLRPGLSGPGGKPLGARLDRIVVTPPFSIVATEPESFGPFNLPARPEIQVQFNAAVSAREAESFFEFRSPAAGRVAARVRQGNVLEVIPPWRHGPGFSPLTWEESFVAATNAGGLPTGLPLEPDATPPPRPNLLIVSPVRPLPVASNWTLVAARRLPSADGRYRTPAEWSRSLGDVEPFDVRAATAENAMGKGKRLELRFSKPLSAEVTSTNATNWFSVTPQPEAMGFQPDGPSLTVTGRFALDQRYTLRVRAGLPAAEPFQLEPDFTREFEFQPVPPRVYLPAFDTAQLSGGRREFEVLAVNVEAVRLRARLLDRHSLIHALRGYRRYFRQWEERADPDEPYREVDFEVIPGRVIADRTIAITNRLDDPARLKVDWNDLLLGAAKGAVFLSAEAVRRPPAFPAKPARRVGAECLVQLTDLGLLWKTSTDEASVYVFSHASGEPIAGAVVRLVNADNQVRAEARTDAAGFTRLPRPPDAEWVLVESGEDLHAERVDGHWLSPYGFGIDVDWWRDAGSERALMLFSDRPVYRPKEAVHLKMIARDWQREGLSVPARLTGTLRCMDSRGDRFLETNVVFSTLGTAEKTILLPSAPLGAYQIELKAGEREFRHSFRVEEYEPDAFEVSVEARPSYAAGEAIRLPVTAKYLMGRPLSRARVHWSAGISDHAIAPEGFDGFWFGTQVSDDRLVPEIESRLVSGEASLTDQTNLVIDPGLIPDSIAPGPREVEFSVAVVDLNQKSVRRDARFIRQGSAFYLGLGKLPDVVRAGQPLPVQVVAVGADGLPWSEPVNVTVTLRRVEWQTVRVLTAGYSSGYRSEPLLTNIVSHKLRSAAVRRAEDGWAAVSPPGDGSTVVPPAPGQYLLEVRSEDAGGFPVVTTVSLFVTGPEALAWDYRNASQIQVQPDRPLYHPGDTAVVMVKTPISGTALVTVERDEVMRSFVARLEGNAPEIRVPLEGGDAPNVFIGVTILRGARISRHEHPAPAFRYGYCQLNVANPEARLRVTVVPDAADHRPGESIQVAVNVTDATAQPVADAEVTLFAVDEGVLSLMGYETPDPAAFFYRSRPLAVRSYLSLPNLLPEDPAQWRFGNKGFLVGGGGYERVRKNFLALAYWNASLRTDAAGKLSASFPAPDNLTRYRIIAVAVSGADRFGSGESRVRINKPLMLAPALPRLANIGDRLDLRAVVHNQTDEPGDVEVTLRLDHTARFFEPAGSQAEWTRRIHVKAAGSAVVDFPVEFVQAGTAHWTWRARWIDSGHSVASESRARPSFVDAVESTLEVGYPAPLLREIHLARVAGEKVDLLGPASPLLREGQGRVVVRIANTRLNELGGAVEHLLHYPYGCVEQTSSSLLPWLVLRHAPPIAPRLARSAADFDAAIRNGVDRLFSMQTDSGGLSYWPGGREPMLWGSAYGGLVLALARREGVTLPAAKMDRLIKYLAGQVREVATSTEPGTLADRCLACYALAMAGQPESGVHERLFERRGQLSAESRAWLALAVAEGQGPASMGRELIDFAQDPPRPADDWFGSDTREIAVRLLAWLKIGVDEPAVDRLVAELMQSRAGAHWSTTQGNGWSLLALSEYASAVEGAPQAASGRLRWGDTSVDFTLPATPSVVEHVFTNRSERAKAPLWIEKASATRLFTTTTIETRPTVWRQPRQNQGFSLSRRYARLTDDGDEEPAARLRVGDRILVELAVEASAPAHYVAIDDPLPAVLEAVNPAFTSQREAGRRGDADWFSDYRELRADRVLFFRDHLPAGRHLIRYLARVRAAGTATAPSARVEAMYQPDRFGMSESLRLSSEPWE